MELTKEYFDQQIMKLATKEDLNEQTDLLGQMINNAVVEPFTRRFNELEEKLDVRERVDKAEREIEIIKRTLKLA